MRSNEMIYYNWKDIKKRELGIKRKKKKIDEND
jgi:hypothetical protein